MVDIDFSNLTDDEVLAQKREEQASVSRGARETRRRAKNRLGATPGFGSTLRVLMDALNPVASKRDITSPNKPVSARELGVGSVLDRQNDEPEKFMNVVAVDPETGEQKRYELLAQSEEQAQAVLDHFGVEAVSHYFTDEQMAVASRLKAKGGEILSDGFSTVKDRTTELAQSIEIFAPDSDLLRQLNAGVGIPGLPNAARVGGALGRMDRLSEKLEYIETMIPGAEGKIVPGTSGENELFIKMPTPNARFVPIDISGFPIGGEPGSAMAELEGDIGIIAGEHANMTSALILAAQAILPHTNAFRLVSGKAPGTLKEASGPLTQYLKTQMNNMARRGLWRWAYVSGGVGAAAAFGNIVDNTIEHFRGFQHDDMGEIINESLAVGSVVAKLEGGMRLFAAGVSMFLAPPLRKILRTQEDHVIPTMDVARRYNVPITVADMHPVAGAIALQSQGLSSAMRAFYTNRDVFVRAGLDGFVAANFGKVGITEAEIVAATKSYHAKLLKILDDPESTLGATPALREGIYDYLMTDRKRVLDLTSNAVGDMGGASFQIGKLAKIKADAASGGTRYLKRDLTLDKADRIRGSDGKMVSFSDATMRFPDEPLDPRLDTIFDLIDSINPRLQNLPIMSREGSGNTAIHQIVKIRQKAFAATDRPTNDTSKWVASELYEESKRLMRDPSFLNRAPAPFREQMGKLADYMDESEEIAGKLWVKRMLDRDQQVRFAEDFELGEYFFNLRRPEVIQQVKDVLTKADRTLPMADHNRWEEVRSGFTSKLIRDPASAPKLIADPEHQIALNILYNKGERTALSDMAVRLADMQEGTLARFMQSHMDELNPALELWAKRDLYGMKVLVDEFGGPDTPGGRRMASSFFSMILHQNTVKLDAVEVLDKPQVAKAFSELRAQGWLQVLVGKDQAKLMDIEGIENALDMMIGSSGMANQLVTAGVAQSIGGGGLLDPSKSSRGYRKWLGNYLGGRFLVSPFIFRAAGLPSPRYMGPVEGKYLVPPNMSYLRTFVEILAANHEMMKNDANSLDLGKTVKFSAADIQFSSDSGPGINMPQGGAPPVPGPIGSNAMGLPNLADPDRGGGGEPLIPPPPLGGGGQPKPRPQPKPRSGGGLPTDREAGVPPGPRPKLGPR